MKKEGLSMSNEKLNEKDIQNLFKDLLLQEDLDGERKILQESGLNIDEKSLEEFHKKKEELFAFAKENKDQLQKLDVNDMAAVSGGGPNLVHSMTKSIAKMFFMWLLGYEVQGDNLPLNILVDFGEDLLKEKLKAFAVTTGIPDDPELLPLLEQ